MLALACLDVVLSEDRSGVWLRFLTDRGYLQHLVESLAGDDDQLQAMLNPHPQPLKALYILESKMVRTLSTLTLAYFSVSFIGFFRERIFLHCKTVGIWFQDTKDRV